LNVIFSPETEPAESLLGKRRLSGQSQSKQNDQFKKNKHPAYFVPELAHIVAMCDERLPFALLAHEV
jgi:mediator of RNA polymerase II transcription subunit 14